MPLRGILSEALQGEGNVRAFQAYATGAVSIVRQSAREAALVFFAENPGKRKCQVIEGTSDGRFFTITYGRHSDGRSPQSWKDVTKKSCQMLPGLSESRPTIHASPMSFGELADARADIRTPTGA
jgi:hypothetical protein